MSETPEITEAEAPAAARPRNPMRTIILITLAVLLTMFVYRVLCDRYTPYASQARVETFLTQIASEVPGDVLEVSVKDNSPVTKGQLLFRIDPEPFELAVRSAEANLAVALQAADVSVADVASAKAQLNREQVDLAASRELDSIVTSLVDKQALAETQGIRSRADVAMTQSDLHRAQAEVRRAEANLGAPGLRNPTVRQASAALERARLDLRNTRVTAPADGIVTNLRLSRGQYVSPGQPLLSFLEIGPRWISADMRENQLGNVRPGQEVLISFDIMPGKLRRGRVHSVGSGVSQGDEAPTGQLPTVQPAPGWIREPQRFPVRILLLDDEEGQPEFDLSRSGAQANVIIFTQDESILNPVGRLWMKVIALLSYLQ
jgi:multidrug resistance efflux pump